MAQPDNSTSKSSITQGHDTPQVSLVSYTYEENEQVFQKQYRKIKGAFGSLHSEIEHIGSTAVPGTIGKGIIDILVGLDSWEDALQAREILIKTGYLEGANADEKKNRIFLRDNVAPTIAGDSHIHITVKDSDEFLEPIYFRNALRNNSALVEEYNQIKKRINETVESDRKEYKKKKGEWIRQVTSMAQPDSSTSKDLSLEQRIRYLLVNQFSEYLPTSLEMIEKAHRAGEITDQTRKKLRVTAWRRFFMGYSQIMMISVSNIVIALTLGIVSELINTVVSSRWNPVFQVYRWVTRLSLRGEYGIEEAALEAGYISQERFEIRVESLQTLYTQTIEGFKLSEPDTWVVRG